MLRNNLVMVSRHLWDKFRSLWTSKPLPIDRKPFPSCIFSWRIHFWMLWERLATLSIYLDGLKSSHKINRWHLWRFTWPSVEMKINEKPMKFYENLWKSMENQWFSLIFIDFHLYIRSCDDFSTSKSIDRVAKRFQSIQKWILHQKIRRSCGAEVLSTRNSRRDSSISKYHAHVKKLSLIHIWRCRRRG